MDEADAQLLAQYRRGDTRALERLVVKHQRALYGYIGQITTGRDDPDDVFQEVWLRAISRLRTYRHDNFLGWLVRIARNLVIDRARRRKADVSLDQEDGAGRSLAAIVAGPGPDPRREVEAGALGASIRLAAESLPREQKEVFLMRAQMDLPFKEIARIQGVSINTALARMQYALRKMRTALHEEYESIRPMA
jgi:RNA polymerase sigma-70 factor (ECF subfamily)